MYRRIMVPLDGSPLAEAALVVACELLEPQAGTLVLVRVQEQPVTTVEDERLRCRDYLEIVARQWRQPQRSVQSEVLDRQRRTSLALNEAAIRLECELVVMTSHGRTGLDRRVSGSVAEELARQCPRPVLILGPRTPEVCRIKQELRAMSSA